MTKKIIFSFTMVFLVQASYCQLVKYPESRVVDSSDTYFGIKVNDPYRWLENDSSIETKSWVNAENKVTSDYLAQIPFRAKIKKELSANYNYARMSAPVKYGDYFYFFKNSGLQNEDVMYRMKNPADTARAELFIDPNSFSNNGAVSFQGYNFSPDGSLLAYLISNGGSDWREIIVKDVHTGKLIGDTLRNVKFSDASWRGNDGFYYSTYDIPAGQNKLVAESDQHTVYYHKLGTSQKEDVFIFGGKKQPHRYIDAEVTEDQHWLVINAAETTFGNELYIQDLKKNGSPIRPVITDLESEQSVVDTKDDILFIATNRKAPHFKLVKVNASDPGPSNWTDLIPETQNKAAFTCAGGYFFAAYLMDVKSAVFQYDADGKKICEVKLPAFGTAYGFNALKNQTELYYNFTSFTYPKSIYHYNLKNGKTSFYNKPTVLFNPEDYNTDQVFYTSRDGTKIPMYIVYKKGISLNGNNPTYLYGYGGFDVSLMPAFNSNRMVWLENGGIYAQPNIRGGGEYGEKWHFAGTRMQKQNVFDDFIAAGEYLIKEKYTSGHYLAVAGGSNGGLLVGAVMTQRPDLMQVALPSVGVLDMLRYNKFTAGAGWASDYGTAEDSLSMFHYLLGYSPLHNIKTGVHYPATLIWTADHDDRVVPGHSMKYAATLQKNSGGDHPILISIQHNAGHGTGMDTEKLLNQYADVYSFIWYNMGVNPFK
jgi:prolyl oligopeptidase